MNLTPHFTLEEMTKTSTGIDNTPTPGIVATLTHTANQMEGIRSVLGDLPIIVNSGYRSPAVNRAVGGVPTSQHQSGQAVDFVCPKFGTPEAIARKIIASGFVFDQIIMEGTWVHISFVQSGPNRRQPLRSLPGGGYAYFS
ncbi:endolysin [Burkholderia phage Bm1]